MFFEKSAGEESGKIPSFSANLTSQWLGTLYTAAVSLGLTFLLGRVLGPEGFGTYSYVLTLATLFLVLQDGGTYCLGDQFLGRCSTNALCVGTY